LAKRYELTLFMMAMARQKKGPVAKTSVASCEGARNLLENIRREIGAVADRDYVVEFDELSLDLFQFWLVGHVQQDAAGLAAGQWHNEDGFEVEGAPREQPGDV
jgi:hypothetical protein